MPRRNDVRVSELSSKLNIEARGWNDGERQAGVEGETSKRNRAVGYEGEREHDDDAAHLPLSRGGTIKIKLENKREAGSYYKVF